MRKAPKLLRLGGFFVGENWWQFIHTLQLRVRTLENTHLTREVLHWYNLAQKGLATVVTKTKAPYPAKDKGLLNCAVFIQLRVYAPRYLTLKRRNRTTVG